jgi:hypothetical protein
MATDTDLSRLKDYVNSESTEINNLDTVHKPLTAAPLKVTPPLSWRHKIRRRLHPYASLISVLGIAIPLGIFLIKDVLCDRKKDLLESLETARAEARVKQITKKIDGLQSGIDHIKNDLHSIWAQSIQQSDHEMFEFECWENNVSEKLRCTENDIDSMVAFSAKVPSDFPDRKRYECRLAELEGQAKQIASKCDALSEAYLEVATPVHSIGILKRPLGLQAVGTQEERDQKFLIQNAPMQNGINSDLGALVSTVEKEKFKLKKDLEEETADTTYHLIKWTYFSRVLYPVSVLITLLGGLAGVKISGAE